MLLIILTGNSISIKMQLNMQELGFKMGPLICVEKQFSQDYVLAIQCIVLMKTDVPYRLNTSRLF